MALTPKQAAFCQEYLIDLNATQAAIRAGYSKRTAKQQGARLLTNVDVAAEIEKHSEKRSERTKITQDWVIQKLDELHSRALNDEVLPVAAKALELLGKHVGAFRDRIEHTGKDGAPIQSQVVILPRKDD